MSLQSVLAQRPLTPIQRPTHTYPETYSLGDCCSGCRGISVGYSPLPGSIFQCSTPACRCSLQCPLVSLSGLSEGLIMWVISPLGTCIRYSGRWMGWEVVVAAPPSVLFQHGGAPTISASSSLGRTGCLGWPLPSIRACRAMGQVILVVSILHGKGPRSPFERSGTSQVVWQVCPPWGPGLGRPCHWPRQKNLSASFFPSSAVCRNILWRMMGQWGPSISHLGYSLRNNLASSQCSASLIDSPASLACSLADWDLPTTIYFHNTAEVMSGNWSKNKSITLSMTNCTINIKHDNS